LQRCSGYGSMTGSPRKASFSGAPETKKAEKLYTIWTRSGVL
jgi:hypothetical protein